MSSLHNLSRCGGDGGDGGGGCCFLSKVSFYRTPWKFFYSIPLFLDRVAHWRRLTFIPIAGGYKEMSSIFADQQRPRNTSPNAGEGGGVAGYQQMNSCAHHVTWSPK
jgi:hypothetical protein